jgi:hypothetical protein
MHPEPAPPDPGRDENPGRHAAEPVKDEVVPWEPVVTRPDPMSQEEQQALLDAVTDDDAPWWLEEGDSDPQEGPPPEECDLAQVIAECRQAAEDQARADASGPSGPPAGACAAEPAAGCREQPRPRPPGPPPPR